MNSMAASATGWAIKHFDKIDVRTVHDTRRGAIVNWLVVSAKRVVTNAHSDEDIEQMWREARGGHPEDAQVIQIIMHEILI